MSGPGRLARLLAPLAVAGLLVACDPAGPARVQAPPDSAAGEIGFELAGPNGAALIVPVYLNGQGPFDFVLDTGATLTCVDEAVVEQLELSQQRGRVALGSGVGGSGQVRIVEIDSVRVGEARAFELSACVLDLRSVDALGVEIDGLLGLNFLKSFRVALDFERNALQLQAP